MKTIPLTQGLVTVVDDEDYERLSVYHWWASGPRQHPYATRQPYVNGRKRTVSMSRQILDAQPGQIVDHVNRDTLDNRRANLRFVTWSQNRLNSRLRSSNTSGFIGIERRPECARWKAQFEHEGRVYYLGLFATPEAAARAYDAKALELAGDYAVLNFGRGRDGS